jgi:membrane protein implicated in regulation of membrane protease activity
MKAGATSSSRTLLDFGAGFLFGLSITVALFAAMEDDVGPLAHTMLLTALAVLGLAIAMKLAARARSRRRRTTPGRARDAGVGRTGWTVDAPRGPAAEARAGGSSSNDLNASRDERTSAALPELKVAHRNTQTTAEGDSRRL